MRIVIDLDRLLAEGRIDSETYERLKSPASPGKGSLALNILLGFCVIVVATGVPYYLGGAPFAGLSSAILGASLATRHGKEWSPLGVLMVALGSVVVSLGTLIAMLDGL